MDQSESTAANLDRRSRRRWLQFSLRGFLIVLTAFAVWLGMAVNRARNQRETIKEIESMGGSVHLIPGYSPLIRKWLGPIIGDDFIRHVNRVVLRKGRYVYWFEPGQAASDVSWQPIATDADMELRLQQLIPRLQRLPWLSEIHIEEVPSTDPRFSADTINQLKHALPNCEVIDVRPEMTEIDKDNRQPVGSAIRKEP